MASKRHTATCWSSEHVASSSGYAGLIASPVTDFECAFSSTKSGYENFRTS